MELRKGTGKILLPFTAREVNLVIQPGPSGTAAVSVLPDGKPGGDVGVQTSAQTESRASMAPV